MKVVNKIIHMFFLSSITFAIQSIDIIEWKANLKNKDIAELNALQDSLERDFESAQTTQGKDALSEKQFWIFKELVRRGDIF